MPLSKLRAALLLALLASPPLQAALLCEQPPCKVVFEFPAGGSIAPDQGMAITFGSGGQLVLGSGGTIDYGADGSGEPATTGSEVPDLSAGGRIVLGQGGSIHFGEGGRLSTGESGQIEAPDGSAVQVNSARMIDIDAEASVHIGKVKTSGSILIEGESIDTGPAPFHFVTANDPEAQFAVRSRRTVFIESFEADRSIVLESTQQNPPPPQDSSPPQTPPSDTPPPEDTGCGGSSGGGTGSGSSGSLTISSGDGAAVNDPSLNSGSPSQICSPTISGGEFTAGPAVLVEPAGGSGGGAFPSLLLALFGALRYAARRLRHSPVQFGARTGVGEYFAASIPAQAAPACGRLSGST